MQNFRGIVFIQSRAYSEMFKSALVYPKDKFLINLNVRPQKYIGK